MKRLTIISCLLSLILGAGIWSIAWLGKCTEELSAGLSAAAELARRDSEKALDDLQAIQGRWEEVKKTIGLFIHEEPLEEFSYSLSEFIATLELGRQTDFQIKARQTVFALEDLYRRELPTLTNIF